MFPGRVVDFAASSATTTSVREILMRPQKRRSNVHDWSALRIHPDGTRATAPSSQRRHVSGFVTRDARNDQWIAHDAAGVERIPRHVNAATPDDESSVTESIANDDSSKYRKRRRLLKDPRAIKRKKLLENVQRDALETTGLQSEAAPYLRRGMTTTTTTTTASATAPASVSRLSTHKPIRN
jgi:hypothetical protein